MHYTCIDAFSGAGGLSLGLQRAGFEILLSFDNDKNCIKTQLSNPRYFKHKSLLADIDQMLNGGLLSLTGLVKGQLFLLAGGPPCQGFSVQRIGSDKDTRNELVIKYIHLVGETLPDYFMMENVSGITGKRGKPILSKALSLASDYGYRMNEKKLDAQDYGVPQRRKRMFIVGEKISKNFQKEFSFPMPITPEGKRKTVRDTIGNLPPPPDDGKDYPGIPHHRKDRLSETNKLRLQALKGGQGRTFLPTTLLADCHKLDAAIIGHRNVYGRMAWDEVSPTITARFDSFTRGQFGHPEQIRSISLREGAMLQTFPPDFVFTGNKVEVARQIGNAVPPQLAEILGKQIIKSYECR